MAVFRSKATPTLLVEGKRIERAVMIEGRTVIRTETPVYEFKNSVFFTEDPKAIEDLRGSLAHKHGLFMEDPGVKQAPPPAGGQGKADPGVSATEAEPVSDENPPPDGEPVGCEVVSGITSKNHAIQYLVQKKGAKPEDLRELKAAELKAVAKATFHVDFTDWSPA